MVMQIKNIIRKYVNCEVYVKSGVSNTFRDITWHYFEFKCISISFIQCKLNVTYRIC